MTTTENLKDMRDIYPENVGTILVGESKEPVLAAMADPRIDFIIPFHRSGWGKKQMAELGLTDYSDFTKQQNEYVIATGKKAKGNLEPLSYWDYSKTGKENAQIYLDKCAELGLQPKFSAFLQKNEDGKSWRMQDDGSTDGYWKTLIDFKMYDNNGVGAPQQSSVSANFNMEAAQRILAEYDDDPNRLPVAEDVVDEFVKEYQGKYKRDKYS